MEIHKEFAACPIPSRTSELNPSAPLYSPPHIHVAKRFVYQGTLLAPSGGAESCLIILCCMNPLTTSVRKHGRDGGRYPSWVVWDAGGSFVTCCRTGNEACWGLWWPGRDGDNLTHCFVTSSPWWYSTVESGWFFFFFLRQTPLVLLKDGLGLFSITTKESKLLCTLC